MKYGIKQIKRKVAKTDDETKCLTQSFQAKMRIWEIEKKFTQTKTIRENVGLK